MKNRLLISILAILLVALGGMFYLKTSHKPPTAAELKSNKKSLYDLLQTPNTTCNFQINDKNTGVMYASDSSFRIDFNEGKITNTHIISDLTNVFLWFDEKNIGIRVAWPIDLTNSELDLISARFLDLGINVDSQCKRWKTDNSKFELPNIDFKDFGEKIPGPIYENEDSPEKRKQCAACQQLDPKDAAKCRINLDCG